MAAVVVRKMADLTEASDAKVAQVGLERGDVSCAYAVSIVSWDGSSSAFVGPLLALLPVRVS